MEAKRFTFTFQPIEGREIVEGDFAYDPVLGIGNVVKVYNELCFQSIRIKGKGTITAPIVRLLDDKRPYEIVSIIEK